MPRIIIHKRIASRGFTMIELVVVIALLAIMAALAIPSLTAMQAQGDDFNEQEAAAMIEDAYLLARSMAVSDGELVINDELTAITILADSPAEAEKYIYRKMVKLLPDGLSATNYRLVETFAADGSSTIAVTYPYPPAD